MTAFSCYFGYPRAAEDDALRAVGAAWELVHVIPDLRLPHSVSALRSDPLPTLRARVSLHTGLAIVGDVVGRDSLENDDALGAAPNIAAKLQSLGQPGDVVVSDVTAALLPPSIRLQALEREIGRQDVGAVRAFVVADVPRDFMQRRTVSAAPLVGRHAVLERLLAYVNPAGTEVGGVLLCAEPGLGKSRLVQELVKHPYSREIAWVQLACSAYGQVSPLHPFRDWSEVRGAELTTSLAPGGGDQNGAHADGSEDPASPYLHRRRIFEDLRNALLAHAPRVGLIIEDIHWADSTTLEFVAELLLTTAPGRLILLMTSRQAPSHALTASGRLRVERLDRLAPGDAAALARALSAARPLTAFELAEIVEHADGVPLFIEEFVRAIPARGAGDDHIPITLRDSLTGVLDTLGKGRTVALCASVFGRRFEYAHLKALLELDDLELARAVEALVKAQVLVQSGDIPNASLEFRHALLCDTAYHTMLKSERQRWHRRVAELAAAGRLAIEDSMPELLARHHSLGGSYECAIGFWLRAQRRAMQRSASVEALAHLRNGLDDCRHLAKEAPGLAAKLELELLRRLTGPLIAISGWSTPELEDVYLRAMGLCRSIGSEDAAFELERGLCNMHMLRSELRSAHPFAEQLMTRARAEPESERRETLLLMALRSKALLAFYGASYAEGRVLLEELLALYDAKKHAGHGFYSGTEPATPALSYLAWMDAVDGSAPLARKRVAQALTHARAEGHVFSVCYALCFAASCEQLLGDAEGAAAYAAEALSLANQHNFQYWIAWAQAIQGWVRGLEKPCEGIALIDAARTAYLATGSSLVAPYFQALACNIAAAGGEDVAEREAQLREAGRKTGVWFWEGALKKAAMVHVGEVDLVSADPSCSRGEESDVPPNPVSS